MQDRPRRVKARVAGGLGRQACRRSVAWRTCSARRRAAASSVELDRKRTLRSVTSVRIAGRWRLVSRAVLAAALSARAQAPPHERRRRPARPRRPARRPGAARSGCTPRRRRMGGGRAQPAADHRRPAVHRRDARAEMRVGSTTLRLDRRPRSRCCSSTTTLRVQLHSGSVALRLRNARDGARVRARHRRGPLPRAAHRPLPLRPRRRDQRLTVWSGQAVSKAATARCRSRPGSAPSSGSTPAARPSTAREPERDAFADWNAERDRADDARVATRYVSPEMTGAEDLDRYGRWEQTPSTARSGCRAPSAPGWAPYRYGHWAWVRPWGWTWVDDAPWGFAPFHYGRWVNCRNRWCWAPGTLRRAAGLRAGAGGLGRRAAVGVSIVGRRPAGGRLVPARAARGLRADLPRRARTTCATSTSPT